MPLLPAFLRGFFDDFFSAFGVAFWPTLRTLGADPWLLFHPLRLRRIFFARVWSVYAEPVDSGGHAVKERLLTPHAHGVVLDIGAGHGHTMRYLDKTRVTRYIALEPNEAMHTPIRRTAAECGFSGYDGTLVVLSAGLGAADATRVLDPASVDTLVSVLTLCSVPQAEHVLPALVHTVLKPGGQLLFYEHVASPSTLVWFWQRLLSPAWEACFDGCTLGLPTDAWIARAADGSGGWAEQDVWGKDGESVENLWYHKAGRFVRAPVT